MHPAAGVEHGSSRSTTQQLVNILRNRFGRVVAVLSPCDNAACYSCPRRIMGATLACDVVHGASVGQKRTPLHPHTNRLVRAPHVRLRKREVVVCSLNRRGEDVDIAKSPISSRDTIRLGIPSKGRMAEDTLELLKTCQLKCVKPNPRQYFGQIPQFSDMEVWFQRASDVVRKLRTCDLDLGIVGMDMFAEFAAEDEDLVIVHDALAFGHCKLALGVPITGEFAEISTLEELKQMGWSETRPLRVVTGYTNIARRCEYALTGLACQLHLKPGGHQKMPI